MYVKKILEYFWSFISCYMHYAAFVNSIWCYVKSICYCRSEQLIFPLKCISSYVLFYWMLCGGSTCVFSCCSLQKVSAFLLQIMEQGQFMWMIFFLNCVIFVAIFGILLTYSLGMKSYCVAIISWFEVLFSKSYSNNRRTKKVCCLRIWV